MIYNSNISLEKTYIEQILSRAFNRTEVVQTQSLMCMQKLLNFFFSDRMSLWRPVNAEGQNTRQNIAESKTRYKSD